MPRLITRLLLGLVAVLLPVTCLADDGPVVMIAHPGVDGAELQRDGARAIFAMRQRLWPNGQAVHVFVLPNGDSVHARFVKKRLGVYPHQLQLSWDRVVFSGTGQAPVRVSTQSEMLEQVAGTPGALGYIEKELLDDRVQVVSME